MHLDIATSWCIPNINWTSYHKPGHGTWMQRSMWSIILGLNCLPFTASSGVGNTWSKCLWYFASCQERGRRIIMKYICTFSFILFNIDYWQQVWKQWINWFQIFVDSPGHWPTPSSTDFPAGVCCGFWISHVAGHPGSISMGCDTRMCLPLDTGLVSQSPRVRTTGISIYITRSRNGTNIFTAIHFDNFY